MSNQEHTHVTTVDDQGQRHWIYAWQPKGVWYRRRTVLSIIYLLIFILVPFLSVNGKPIFLLNFPSSLFVIFGKVFLPQDFVVFSLAMLIFLVFIVLFTVVFGRIFCGWMCPQTIFMEMVFRKVEFWVEGTASQQKKLNKGPRDLKYYYKKVIKHSLFILISLLIAVTAVNYIFGIKEVGEFFSTGFVGNLQVLAGILIFALIFYIVFAFVRELVCTVVCPYGRLQEVLIDEDTLVIAYDQDRGEPRMKGRRPMQDVGDCVDCDMCQRVCPTGIDIRDGKQLECVNCTACIDACNDVMTKVNLPKGLIRFASESNISSKKGFTWTPKRRFYSIVLVLLIGLFSFTLSLQKDVEFTVIKVPGQVLQEHDNGDITNLFRIMIDNKAFHSSSYDISVDFPDATIEWVGHKVDTLAPLSQSSNTFFVRVPGAELKNRKTEMKMLLSSDGEVVNTKTFTFISEF